MPGRSFWARQVVRNRNGKCAVELGACRYFGGNSVQTDSVPSFIFGILQQDSLHLLLIFQFTVVLNT